MSEAEYLSGVERARLVVAGGVAAGSTHRLARPLETASYPSRSRGVSQLPK